MARDLEVCRLGAVSPLGAPPDFGVRVLGEGEKPAPQERGFGIGDSICNPMSWYDSPYGEVGIVLPCRCYEKPKRVPEESLKKLK
jgi:hypothetical protein